MQPNKCAKGENKMSIDELELQEDKNRAIERFLLESKVTSSQASHLIDFMEYVSDKIDKGEEVSKEFFEDEILTIAPEKHEDDNFCKFLAECWQKENPNSRASEYFYGF